MVHHTLPFNTPRCILPSPVLSIEDQRTLRNALYSVAALQQGIYGWQDWSLPVYSSYTLGGMPDDMDTTRVRLPDDLLLRGSVLHLDTDAAGAAVCIFCGAYVDDYCCWLSGKQRVHLLSTTITHTPFSHSSNYYSST